MLNWICFLANEFQKCNLLVNSFSMVFLFFRKKETKKPIFFKLIQDESASGAFFTSLTAIFFDPVAHSPCALSKLRLPLRSNLSLGLTVFERVPLSVYFFHCARFRRVRNMNWTCRSYFFNSASFSERSILGNSKISTLLRENKNELTNTLKDSYVFEFLNSKPTILNLTM